MNSRTFLSRLCCLLVLALLATPGQAEQPEQPDQPRIGLALGGGGARGAAHVGVIRVLEEQNIRVDYVAGTSMGAIVGALYALGLTADEIERELLAVDWAGLFDDRMNRRSRTMRRKDDDTSTFFPLEFGFRGHGLATPRGLIAGQKFAFAFPNPGLITAGHESFDDLPIPYRAVATDLETGEKVVLDHGSLIRAVRASMSIPGVFSPVEIDGRTLVDGYLTSNVPVDVVRAMGADIVIAVEVGRRPDDTTSEELQSFGGIREQASRIQSSLAVRAELERADIVIQPLLDRWKGDEYDHLDKIFGPGETAAREHLDELAALSISAPVFHQWRAAVSSVPMPIPAIDRVELINQTRIVDDILLARLDVELGQSLDLPRLESNLEEIYELGLVESSDFSLARDGDEELLQVFVHEKPYAPYLVFLGGSYRMHNAGLSPFRIHARINKLEINRRGAEWRTDLSVGSIFGIRTEFYQPIDFQRRWFVAPQVLALVRDDGLFINNQFVLDYRFRQVLGVLDLGRTIGRTAEFRGGVFGGYHGTKWTGALFPVPQSNDQVVGARVELKVDTLDDHRVPHHGVKVSGHFASPQGWLGTDLDYDRTWGQFLIAGSKGRSTVIFDTHGGTDLGSDMPYYQQFFLGGLRAVSGYQARRLRGSAYGVASIGWLYKLAGSDMLFTNRGYLGLWFDAGNTWFDSRDASLNDIIYSAAISLLIETPLGPLHFGYGRSDDGNDAIHLEFGIHLATPND